MNKINLDYLDDDIEEIIQDNYEDFNGTLSSGSGYYVHKPRKAELGRGFVEDFEAAVDRRLSSEEESDNFFSTADEFYEEDFDVSG